MTALANKIGQGQSFHIIKALYDFSEKTGTVEWGTGGGSGSFTLKVQHPKSQKGLISLITVWKDGKIEFRLGNMRNRVGQEEVGKLCQKLHNLPFAKLWDIDEIENGYGPKHSCAQAFPDEKSLEAFKQLISEYLKDIMK